MGFLGNRIGSAAAWYSDRLFVSEEMHVRWNEKYVVEQVTGHDCEWAAWLYSQYGTKSTFLFWDTVRDLMLAGF
jgi:hypothetical protein